MDTHPPINRPLSPAPNRGWGRLDFCPFLSAPEAACKWRLEYSILSRDYGAKRGSSGEPIDWP